jgi:hypothetical protein
LAFSWEKTAIDIIVQEIYAEILLYLRGILAVSTQMEK